MGIYIQAGAVIALDAIVFDDSTSTSELWLAGDDGVELSALAGTLFTLQSGAPPIHLSGLRAQFKWTQASLKCCDALSSPARMALSRPLL